MATTDATREPGGYEESARQDATIPAPASERRSRLLLAVGLLFVFGPAVAYVGGSRPHEIENRKLAAFPSLSDGWKFFPELNTWANDHLPLRDRAIKSNTSLSETLFNQTPQYGSSGNAGIGVIPQGGKPTGPQYPRVLQGKSGWLFYGGDIQNACTPVATLDDAVAGLQRFTDIIERSGRKVVFTIAPDKSEMNPQFMPDDYLGKDCAPPARAKLWARMKSAPPSSYVDIKQPLADLAAQSTTSLWRPHDTHWATRGAAVYAQAVIDAIRPGLWKPSELTSIGPVHRQGDLSRLLGTPVDDIYPGYVVKRPGVTVTKSVETLLSSQSTDAPLITGGLILGDSFTQASRDLLAPFFDRARILHPKTATVSPNGLAGAIKGSTVIVLEIVERDMVAGNVPVANKTFLDDLEVALR
jgi:hypothetical protein